MEREFGVLYPVLHRHRSPEAQEVWVMDGYDIYIPLDGYRATVFTGKYRGCGCEPSEGVSVQAFAGSNQRVCDNPFA